VQIRYYFDDEEKPRIDMDVSTFVSEKNPLGHFREPLSRMAATFRVMYCPCNSRTLKIALSRRAGRRGQAGRSLDGRFDKVPSPRRIGVHSTYHTFSEDPGIPPGVPARFRRELTSALDSKKIGAGSQTDVKANQTIKKDDFPLGRARSLPCRHWRSRFDRRA